MLEEAKPDTNELLFFFFFKIRAMICKSRNMMS